MKENFDPYRGRGGVRGAIEYVMRKMKTTKRTDGQFSGHFIFPKKFCFHAQNRFCVFEKSFFAKFFQNFFPKNKLSVFKNGKFFIPRP